MAVFNKCVAVGVDQVETVAAYLRAFTTVGAAARGGETCLTVAAVADAQSAVDKRFQRSVGNCLVDRLHFLKRHFARQNQL